MVAPAPMREQITPLYTGILSVLRPLLDHTLSHEWRGGEHLPRTGGFVAAPNHLSHFDPFAVGLFLVHHGRAPHFLAKSSLFEPPVVRHVLQGTRQIPVRRETSQALDALTEAVAAVDRGACVCIYPEGTITRAPGYWPMSGKSGAARVALQTGCPLIPVATWGTQDVLEPYHGKFVPRLGRRHPVVVQAGPPIDLDDLRGRPLTADVLRDANDRLMGAITVMLEEIRGEQAPEHRFDLRRDRPVRGRSGRPGRVAAAWGRRSR